LGILLCGTGIGMSIVANRYRGVRAALAHDTYTARLAKAHNNANVLVLGGRVTGPGLAEEIVDTWLKTRFEGGRHQRRVNLVDGEC
jgi:ribose 5-phosphate isomerase B